MKSKKNKKKIKQSRKVSPKIIAVILIAVILLVLVYYPSTKGSEKWMVGSDGLLSYPESRGNVDVTVLKSESGDNFTLETISFPSKDYTVKGLMRIPSSGKKVPAIVILPGATVHVEGTQGLAQIFSQMGYASLGIEQRNVGGVDTEHDLEMFREGKEPIEHKMVFDALRAFDVLKQNPRIDEKKIAILGESNGGRFAIIAAALDPSISGVIGISTSGYNTEAQIGNIKDETIIRFYRSIDPDTYLGLIPPRKLVMLHSVNDSIIPIYMAENTFGKAKEPKQFYKVGTGNHGFNEGMRENLEKELRLILLP